jgi:hypothetical protein
MSWSTSMVLLTPATQLNGLPADRGPSPSPPPCWSAGTARRCFALHGPGVSAALCGRVTTW